MYPYPTQQQPYSAQQFYPSQQPYRIQPSMPQYPYQPHEPMLHPAPLYPELKRETLRTVEPFVQYGLSEAQYTSFPHALTEVAAITYLIGRGFNPRMAHRIVESWEVDEKF